MMKELNDIDEGKLTSDNTRTPVEWHCKMCREPARDGINDKQKSFLLYDANIQFRYINYLNNII